MTGTSLADPEKRFDSSEQSVAMDMTLHSTQYLFAY